MSYEIIKSIKFKDGKVLIRSSSNNVTPKYFEEFESESLSKILQEQGTDAAELEIFKQFENGCFQRGVKKYLNALSVLHHFPEYQNFNWRNNDDGETDERRKSAEFDALLLRALKTRLPKDKFVLKKENGVYLRKITKRYAKWDLDKAKAKIFRFADEAEGLKRWFTNSESWMVEKI